MFILQAPSPQKDPKEEPALGVVAAIMSLFGLAAQLWVGWDDDHRITLHTETNAELDALLPSILDRAFKGEL